jgi:hypothetical protein
VRLAQDVIQRPEQNTGRFKTTIRPPGFPHSPNDLLGIISPYRRFGVLLSRGDWKDVGSRVCV